ncbi:MAG: VanW family protein [Chloroflexi bacterium]|nr:VanW family protein [Chloroflexota bacterium]
MSFQSTVRSLPRAFLFLYALLGLACLVTAFIGAYQFFYSDRVILGVNVFGESLSGMTRAEAQQFLENKFGQPDQILAHFGGQAIVLTDGARVWRAYPWELGLRVNYAPVADHAASLGHRGAWNEIIADQARCLWSRCDLGGEAQFDDATAHAYLGWIAPQVEREPRDATVRIENARVIATAAQKGRALDGDAMLARLRARVLGQTSGAIEIAFRETDPLITDVETARKQADAILSAPILLTFNERAWALDRAMLAQMILIAPQQDADGKVRLVASLDRAQLATFLAPIAREVNQPARDARFRFENGALAVTVPSQSGQLLEPDAAAKQIEQQLFATAARSIGVASPRDANARTIALPVKITKPTIAMEDAAKFGIKELVTRGESNFRGSSAGRIQNIRTATDYYDGVVIPPGGTFSFVQLLGEVVEANGFDDAYIIFEDRTVLGPGGGVCQVSSTIFRAAFFGGFPIVERWAHAYRVGFYEPPVGLDATVFAPTVDLKFKNDLDSYLLIQPKLDLKNFSLAFNFYGTKSNRTVEMEEPIKENIIPHGADVYTDDPTLKKGITKQVDFAHDGMDVTVNWLDNWT